MRKKKVLVHGTHNTLRAFFEDALSCDYEIVAILSAELEKVSSINFGGKEFEVLPSQEIPKLVQRLIDGVILTDYAVNNSIVNFFIKQGFEFRKIIPWSEQNGFESLAFKNPDGTTIGFIGGLEFHIRDKEDEFFFINTINRFKTIRIYRNIDQKFYSSILAQTFQRFHGRPLDFNKLKTYTEKMQWIKLYDATPLKSRLADKFLVRNWVEEKIGSQYLIPLLGVWDDFDDINFDELPDQFVLKCNHGSGMNIIVRDKKTFDKQSARERINAWMAQDFAMMFLELHYTRINRKIIAEKFMANGDLPDIENYKFWCFEGKPLYCGMESGRSAEGSLANLCIDFFDTNWKITDIERSDHPRSAHPEEILPPKNFELMKELATKLAEGFAHVRVDFYEIDDKVYFGEMTFTPGAGNFSWKSKSIDKYLGRLFKLPEPTQIPKP